MTGTTTPAAVTKPPLPATLLIGAAARCLLEESLERRLAPWRAEAEIERVAAAAYQKDKESGGLSAAVLARLASVSLFGARRIVVVFGGQELLRDKAAKGWIEKPSARAHLVIAVVRSPKDGLPAIPAGLAVESAWDPGPQSPGELRRFLEKRLAARDGKATPAALDLLIEQAGASLDALDSELEKLALFRLGETIDAPHVESLCGHTAGRDFDRLWNALGERRLATALDLVATMADEGLVMFGGGRVFGATAVANTLLPLLLSRIRKVAAVGAGQERLAAAAGESLGMKPGYVHFLQQDARSLGPRLLAWQRAALVAEIQQKRMAWCGEEEVLGALLAALARA